MVSQIIHNATITLQLSFYLSIKDRVAALRAAGIPVDDMGNASSGYLFVRTTGRVGRRKNTYRWFATGIGQEPVVASASTTRARAEQGCADPKSGAPPRNALALSAVLPAQELVPPTIMYLRLWKELEHRSREAANNLHQKQIAYFRDQGPPPDALDRELLKEATVAASKCLLAAKDQNRLPLFESRFHGGHRTEL